MGAVPKPEHSIASKFNDLERRVRAIEASNPLQAGATISGGGLTAKDPNTGHTTSFQGLGGFNDGSGRKQMESLFYRASDGSIALAIFDGGVGYGHTYSQALQIYDRTGDVILADDTASAQGLARPYIPIGFFTSNSVPTDTTTSTSFATLQTLIGYKQHPKVAGQILVYADTGTTGTIQLVDQLSNVLYTTNLTSGQFGYVSFGPTALAGAHELAISLNIQGKVLTGAGKVGARGVAAWGVQS
jgi:hypothetical protein